MNQEQIKWCEQKVTQMKAQIKEQRKQNESLTEDDYEKIVSAVDTLIKKSNGNREVREYMFENFLEPLDKGIL